MKKAECAENESIKSAKNRVSAWYYIDFAVNLLVSPFAFFISFFYTIYFKFFAIEFVCFFVMCIFPDYYKKPPAAHLIRVIMGIVRAVVYTVALTVVALSCMQASKQPVFYPVDKAVFCANYTDPDEMFFFLPDKIPSNARDYQRSFMPGWLDRASISIDFFTDTAQLEEYRNFAQSRGAVKVETNKDLQEYLNERTGREEAVEVWEFPEPKSGGYHATYCICPESGYLMINW
ncbi:MAG: hypothetical protein K2K57_03170 [Oscillospiraceae bacterium]|nr:hypothetical protein [Oscillospiraceae bacterium]